MESVDFGFYNIDESFALYVSYVPNIKCVRAYVIYLIAEDFDLTISTVRWGRVGVSVRRRLFVRVHLNVQRQSLHALLAGEVCTETLHRHVDL